MSLLGVRSVYGVVYIENGVYKGFGFCSMDLAGSECLNFITPYQDNKDVRRILMRNLIRHGLAVATAA